MKSALDLLKCKAYVKTFILDRLSFYPKVPNKRVDLVKHKNGFFFHIHSTQEYLIIAQYGISTQGRVFFQ